MPAWTNAGPPTLPSGARSAAAPYIAILLGASLCARAMLAESYERLDLSILDAATSDLGSTPLSAAGLDTVVLLLATALFTCLDWAWSRAAVVASGASVALWIAANLSSAVAAEPAMARLASANLWITALAGVGLSIAARDRAVARILVAALLATGVTIATKCVLQHYVEAADTLEAWLERKQELTAAGANLDDPMIVNYERRVQSLARESTGFHYHANITASCLLLAVLPALGIFVASLSRRGAATSAGSISSSLPARGEIALAGIVSAIIVGSCALGLALTGSKGGIGAAVISVAVLFVLGGLARKIAARAATTILLGALTYLGIFTAGAAYGAAFGTLPIASLAFRWYYWAAALPAWLDAPLTGIGRLNFADAFLRYKSPACVEDVRDPHNLWVSLLVETGPIAVLAAATLLAIAGYYAIVALVPVETRANSGAATVIPPPGAPRIPSTRVIPLGLVAIASLAITHAVAGGVVAMQGALLAIWLFEVVLVWSFAFIAAMNALAELNESDPTANPWLRAACIAGVAGVLIHSLIDFALMTPAGLSLFVVAIAVAAAPPPRESTETPAPFRWTRIASCALVGLVLVSGQFLFNVVRPWVLNHEVREIGWYARDPLDTLSRKVHALERHHDPDPSRRAAELLINAATESTDLPRRLDLLALAAESFEASLRLNPRAERTHRRLAMVHDALAKAQRERGDSTAADQSQRRAADEWLAAVACSPTNPRTRISAARALLEIWSKSTTPALAQSVRDELDAARRIDATRPLGDTVRLSDAALREIDDMLTRLAAGPASASMPTSNPVSPP